MQAPSVDHWAAVKRIIRYLKHTITASALTEAQIHFSLTLVHIQNWAGCPDDRCSTSGYSVYMGSNLVSRSSRKQTFRSRKNFL